MTPLPPVEGRAFPAYDVEYESPSAGLLTFGWDAPFTVNGSEVSLFHDLRHDNPWAQTEFNQRLTRIEDTELAVVLDFENGVRTFESKPR